MTVPAAFAGAVVETNAVGAVRINGTPVPLVEGRFSAEVPVVEGAQTIAVEADDLAGNVGTASVSIVVAIPPSVAITTPPSLSVFGAGPVTVTGTVDDPTATIVVNGVPATLSGGTFTAPGVPLREGTNFLIAVATDPLGHVGTANVAVVLDTAPPTVRIETPANEAIVTEPRVTVTGLVHDVVTGTVNADDATVTVNGLPAQILNRSFLVRDIPLQPGRTTLVAEARDRAGNLSRHEIAVTFQALAGARIIRVAGHDQTGVMRTALADPLVIVLVDAAGNPVAGRPVLFAVTRGDGSVRAGSGPETRTATVLTDSAGQAGVTFTVGTRSSAGGHRVLARADGFLGEALFGATATPGPPAHVKTIAGEIQRGTVGLPLPEPQVAVVQDEGGNPVGGVPVVFEVTRGGGRLAGQPTQIIVTDGSGHARATWTLGLEPGLANHIVLARVADAVGLPAAFVASGVVPGPPEQTRVSGVVLDHANVPLPGVTARIEGTQLQALTDVQGQFAIPNAPVGAIHLRIDGSTTSRPGSWPYLEFVLTTVAGTDNTIGMPIFLLPLDSAGAQVAGGTQDVTVTMREVPGFGLTVVFANSVTFADGSRTGPVTVTQVHHDKVPMPPIAGAAPRLVWTVQPAGVVFDPPARITYPNVDGHRPGQVVDIFSFDHDLGLFVSSGTGTVSPDGAVITSDPGSGIAKAGWGYPAPPPPPPGCAKNATVDMELSPDLIGQDEEGQGNAQGSLDGSGKGCPSPGGSYQWTSDDASIATVSGSGRTATVKGVALGEVPINVRYLADGKEAAASKTIRVGTKDVVIIGWIDGSRIQLPSGANIALVSALSRFSSCILTVATWYGGSPAGILGDIDRRYANAFLVKRSTNLRPPPSINPDAFVQDRHAYKLMNRLKAFYREENGKVVDES